MKSITVEYHKQGRTDLVAKARLSEAKLRGIKNRLEKSECNNSFFSETFLSNMNAAFEKKTYFNILVQNSIFFE